MKNHDKVKESMTVLGVEEEQMNHRLTQIQESLFGTTAVSADEQEDEARGLHFDEFMDKMLEIRPDTDASALDIEVLRVRVERDEKAFNARLDLIEEALTKMNEEGLPPVEKSNENEKSDDPYAKEGSSTKWLREVPTEVLFAVLNSRAPPCPTPPKLQIESG